MSDHPHLRPVHRRIGTGAVVLLGLLAVAVTIGVGVWRTASSPVMTLSEPPMTPGSTPSASAPGAPVAAPVEIYVHVGGAVNVPGLYVLEVGARVVDAIAVAGGMSDDAEPSAVNLARGVTDGEQLIVPQAGQVGPGVPGSGAPVGATAFVGAGPGTTAQGGGAVNLNIADATALDTLPGVGPALAGRIISWREENGGFRSVDDLLAVSGIGEKVLANLRDLVTV